MVRHVTSTWHVLSKVGADDGASHPGGGAQLKARGCVQKAEYGLSEAVDVSRKQERVSLKQRSVSSKHTSHPGGTQWANLNTIFHRCYLREVIFEWELTIETIYLPMGGLQGGVSEQKRCWYYRGTSLTENTPNAGEGARHPGDRAQSEARVYAQEAEYGL